MLLVVGMLQATGGSHAKYHRWLACYMLLVVSVLQVAGGLHSKCHRWVACYMIRLGLQRGPV